MDEVESGLELHVNLLHPTLRDRNGDLDRGRLANLLGFTVEMMAEAVQQPGHDKGAILDPDDGRPLAYWLFTTRDASSLPNTED